MLHAHDPKVADTGSLRKSRDAKAVWFDGGRQWNIVDSYANTLTLKEFQKVLSVARHRRSSAGATIQATICARRHRRLEIVMTPGQHEHGFAFYAKLR